jgi:hypothetical protein
LADPGAPAVISKWNKSPGGHEFLDVCPEWRCLRGGPTIIVDHNPTTVGQQIAIAIQVSAHIVVCIESEEAYFSLAQQLSNG